MAGKTAAPKKSAKKSAPAAAPAETEKESVIDAGSIDRVQFEMVIGDESKNYQKVQCPEGSGCVGGFYVPKGVKTVKVLLIG